MHDDGQSVQKSRGRGGRLQSQKGRQMAANSDQESHGRSLSGSQHVTGRVGKMARQTTRRRRLAAEALSRARLPVEQDRRDEPPGLVHYCYMFLYSSNISLCLTPMVT